jgi:hypothetical protein
VAAYKSTREAMRINRRPITVLGFSSHSYSSNRLPGRRSLLMEHSPALPRIYKKIIGASCQHEAAAALAPRRLLPSDYGGFHGPHFSKVERVNKTIKAASDDLLHKSQGIKSFESLLTL